MSKKGIFWGLVAIGCMVMGFIAENKTADADFEDHWDECYRKRIGLLEEDDGECEEDE